MASETPSPKDQVATNKVIQEGPVDAGTLWDSGQPQATPAAPSTEATLAQQQLNKQSRKASLIVTAILVVAANVLVWFLTMLGDTSSDYSYVQSLSNIASSISYFFVAGSLGVFLAYRAAHPVRLERHPAPGESPKLRPVNTLLVVGGFILGVVPGLIWAFLISYPLSNHACRLSGSKYC